MDRWRVVVPLVGIVVAAAAPLVRYGVMEQQEQHAIDVLRRVHSAQHVFRQRNPGYATDVASLTTPCGEPVAARGADVSPGFEARGYTLHLRAATSATIVGRDCHGRETASDYYMSAAPNSPSSAGREAFAGQSDGRLYLFVDGLPPREGDITSGLAIPVEERASFRIP